MFEAFTQLEETGKQINEFIASSSALLTKLAADVESLRAQFGEHSERMTPLIEQVSRIEAAHESLMGWLAEADEDAISDAIHETQTAAEDAAASARVAAEAAHAAADAIQDETPTETETETSVSQTEMPPGELLEETSVAVELPEVEVTQETPRKTRHFI